MRELGPTAMGSWPLWFLWWVSLRGCWTRPHRQGGSDSRHLFLAGLEAGEAKVKVLALRSLVRAPLPAQRRLPSQPLHFEAPSTHAP